MLQTMVAGAALMLAVSGSTVTGVDELYPPDQPAEPSLSTSAYAECVTDAPWIVYDVTLVDPDDQATSRDVSLVFTKDGQRLEVPLGSLGEDDTLSGRILWPGAATDSSGAGIDWPGWIQQDGEWVDLGEDDLGWTREGATVAIEVNPEAGVAVSYPPSTPYCVVGPRLTDDPPASSVNRAGLAATGAEILAPFLLGATLLTGGLAFATARRRPRM
jgi:hypothetical protein